MELESILNRIVAEPTLHARWLNTFSYLEYVGFRKIIKSQSSDFVDSETLTHALEEGRHALLLKKMAIQFGGAKFDHYKPELMLCPEQASDYFQGLDRACEKVLPNTRSVYLCVTWLIEVRALTVYKQYQRSTEALGIKGRITGLLAEEDRHLISVEKELREKLPDFALRLKELKTLEETLYRRFITAVLEELGNEIVLHA